MSYKMSKADQRVGKWLSAALEDPDVCDEMKADIQVWFKQFDDAPKSKSPTD